MSHSTGITPETHLESLGLLYLDTVLSDVFGILPSKFGPPFAARPQTIGDLAVRSGLRLSVAIERLIKLMESSRDLAITAEDLRGPLSAGARSDILLLDVREPPIFNFDPIDPGTMSLVSLASLDFPKCVSWLQSVPKVVTLCDTGERSYSAAQYLRSLGIARSYYLQDGLTAWRRPGGPRHFLKTDRT